MTNVLVIFASNAQADSPQMGVSDRAAIGLAVSRFVGAVGGYFPQGDTFARNYGASAELAKLDSFPLSQPADFDIALVGQCALAEFGDELAGALAENAGATLVFDVLDVHQEGSTLKITKDAGQGSREEWVVSGPVVMVISAEAVHPPYVSRYRRMMAARNQPASAREPQNDFVKSAADWEAVRLRAKLGRKAESYRGQAEDRMSAAFGLSDLNATSANDRLIKDDAATCARHLMRYLAHHGFLPASLGKALPEREECSAASQPLKLKATSANFRNVSMSQRTARGPRVSDESPRSNVAPSAYCTGGHWQITNEHTIGARASATRSILRKCCTPTSQTKRLTRPGRKFNPAPPYHA